MKTKTLIIIVIVVIIIFVYIKNKKSEYLDSTSGPALSNEAIQSISSVYSNTAGTVTLNNLKVTGSSNLTPKGTVVSWYGDITKIPATWALCDGTNGTPDLRGRFILGYNPTQQTDGSGSSRKPRDMNAIGGNEQLIANIGFHWWPGGDWDNGLMYDAIKDVGFNVLNDNTSSGLVMINAGKQYLEMTSHEDIKNHNRKSAPRPVSVTGKNTTESLPPYYVLAYIMKL